MLEFDRRSLDLRKKIVETMACAGRGHLASAFSLVEIIRVLYDDVLRYDARQPHWPDRDRFILSKGHGCLALYAVLADKGFFPQAELKKFCCATGILGGHPEYPIVPGVETSSGSLGHGLSIGIGFALNARFEKQAYRTIVVLGDGECNEGSIWEAAMCAAKHRLSSLLVIVDYNKQQSYGATAQVQELEPFAAKWKSFGFAVREVDGHDVLQLQDVLQSIPFNPQKPNALICHTIKGKGISFVEGNLRWHHKSRLSQDEIHGLLSELGGA